MGHDNNQSANEASLENLTRWVISKPNENHPRMSALVMAWARDKNTGLPRYILELDKNERGADCNCECISCKQPLIAVNVAKKEYVRRPHFRHPKGTKIDECLVLTAREAALRMLLEDDEIQLPKYAYTTKVEGLSGDYYSAWVEKPSERVRISDFHFEDSANAILTLKDGRKFRVRLTGKAEVIVEQSGEATVIPTIVLESDDPAIASMSPEELRSHLDIIVDGLSWCSYWPDEELHKQATGEAQAVAMQNLDWLSNDDVIHDGADTKFKRETLLHRKAKEIFEKRLQIQLPDMPIEVEATFPNGKRIKNKGLLPCPFLSLESVTLEKHLGPIKPDILAKPITTYGWSAPHLIVEVTVTNSIDEERIERLRRTNLPVLEIDISRMGGTVNEAEFERLIVEEKAGKRWLYHPTAKKIERMTTSQWSDRYLNSVYQYAQLRRDEEDNEHYSDSVIEAHRRLMFNASMLELHGFPEISDDIFLEGRGNLIERLLSMKLNTAVGYKLQTAWQVVNAILQDREKSKKWHTFYLAAIEIYQPTLSKNQSERINKWSQSVHESLERGEDTYRRSRKYDRLISLLFPEMADLVLRPLPGNTQKKAASKPLNTGWNVDRLSSVIDDEPYLKGREYQEWKRLHPDSAKRWENSLIFDRGLHDIEDD